MKLKKSFSMLLAAIMCVTTVTAAMPMNLGIVAKAASDETRINYINNGDFENMESEFIWSKWSYQYSFPSWTAEKTEYDSYRVGKGDNAHEGDYALWVSHKEDVVYQLVEVPAGVTYELTGYVKLTENNGDARFNIVGYSQGKVEDEYMTFSTDPIRFSEYINAKDLELENNTLVRGDWMKFTYTVEATQDTNYLCIRLAGQSGAVYYDDLSLCAELSENIFAGNGQPFEVDPLSKYEISGNFQGNSTSVVVKWQGYSENEINPEYATTSMGETKLEKTGDFSQIINTDKDTNYLAVSFPEDAVKDVAVRKVMEPNRISLLLNSNSYYITEETGVATVTPNTLAFPNTSGWTGTCQLLQGESVIWSQEDIDLSNGEIKITFPLTDCSGEDYVFKTSLYVDGIEMEVAEWSFERCYERPAVLNDEGIFVEKDGDIFHPVMAYHMMSPDISLETIDDCIDRLGVNLFQFNKGYSEERYWGEAIEHLDYLASKGAKAIICLYRSAGNVKNEICSVPENEEATIKYIQAICDHEAIFAWAVQDEPVGHGTSEELMRKAYDMVRTYDTKHRPVYVIDQREHGYPKLIRNADVIAIDNYPYGKFDAMTYIYNSAKYAVETAEASNKPIYTLLQCFENRTGEYINPNLPEGTPYMPTANAIRNMIYQSLMAGTKGFGYYGFDYGPGEDGDAYNFDTSGYVQNAINVRTKSEIVQGIKEYAAKEQDLMFEYFVEKKYPTFNANIDDSEDMRYVSFVRGGKVYMVILNKHEFAEQAVSIPLTSNNGAVTITGFTAKAYAGIADEASEVSGKMDVTGTGSTLDVTMAPGAAAVYIITPNETVDWSAFQDGNNAEDTIPVYTLPADPVVEGNTGLVLNGDFESIVNGEFAYWTETGSASAATGYDGGNAVQVGNGISVEQTFAVEAGQTYELTGYINMDGSRAYTYLNGYTDYTAQTLAGSATRLHFDLRENSDTITNTMTPDIIFTDVQGNSVTAPVQKGGWYKFSYTIKADANYIKLKLAGQSGITLFDNISFCKTEPSLDTGLVSNGNFKKLGTGVDNDVFADWTETGDASTLAATGYGDVGNAVRVSQTNSVEQMIAVESGETYELTGYINMTGLRAYTYLEGYTDYTAQTSAGSATRLHFDLREDSDTITNTMTPNIIFTDVNDNSVTAPVLNGGWYKFSYTVKADANANYIKLKLAGQSGAVLFDTISLYKVEIVDVTDITLDKTDLVLKAGDEVTLSATIDPSDATDKILSWTSTNDTVATVDENGKVKAVGVGSATITATSNNNISATCTVTVNPVVSVDGVNFNGALQDATAAAQAGTVIKLITDIHDAGIVQLNKGTLDLNGFTLEADYFVAYNGTNVIDSSANKTGLLKVAKEQFIFNTENNNAQMPVYNGTEGYVFADIVKQEKRNSEASADTFELIFRPSLGTGAVVNNTLLANGGDAAGIIIGIHLEWTENGETKTQDLVYEDDMVKRVYSEGKAFYIKATGVNSFKNLTITPMVKSKLSDAIVWYGTRFNPNDTDVNIGVWDGEINQDWD